MPTVQAFLLSQIELRLRMPSILSFWKTLQAKCYRKWEFDKMGIFGPEIRIGVCQLRPGGVRLLLGLCGTFLKTMFAGSEV